MQPIVIVEWMMWGDNYKSHVKPIQHDSYLLPRKLPINWIKFPTYAIILSEKTNITTSTTMGILIQTLTWLFGMMHVILGQNTHNVYNILSNTSKPPKWYPLVERKWFWTSFIGLTFYADKYIDSRKVYIFMVKVYIII